MYFLIIMLGMTLGAPQEEPQDMYFNHLNISLGINYKYNGLLYHNIDRVWVVTKVILPKLEDITFPDVKFNVDCSFVNKICDAAPSVKTIIQSMCKSMKPLITLIKQKEEVLQNGHSVHIEGRNSMVSAWQSQLSAWSLKSGSCLCWSEIFTQHQGRDAHACSQKESHFSFYSCYSQLSKDSSRKFKYIPSVKKK